MQRIQRIKSGDMAFGAAETEKTFRITENGHMTDFAFVIPNFTNVVTGVFTVLDEDSVVLYTSAAMNKNATTVVNSLAVPTDRNYTGKLTLSGAPGGTGGTVTAKCWIDTGRG